MSRWGARLLVAGGTFGAGLAVALGAPALWPFFRNLALFLALVYALLSLARSLARADRSRLPWLEYGALAGACGAGFLLLFQNVLVHDALWYFGYLRSALVDGDFDLYEEFVLRNPHGMYLPPPAAPIFYLGTPLFDLPAALLVRPIALILGRAGILPGGDGYGPLEIGAATWSPMMLAVGAVALTHRLSRRYAGGPSSAIAASAWLFASPMAFFAFVWPGYPHPAGAFLAAAFLLVWAREDAAPSAYRYGLLGLLGGALALAHPQDVLYFALPAMDLAGSMLRGERLAGIRRGAALAGGAIAAFAPQLAAWIRTSGRWLPHVYAEIGDPFRWSRPAFLDVLFSGYNGLFTWTPLALFAVAGIFLLRRDHPRVFRGLLAILLLEWWAIASYGYWWGGASLGARYFLSVWPVLGVGLALAVARLARRSGLVVAGLAAAPFVYWNLLLMAQFRLEKIEHNQPPDLLAVLSRQFLEAPGYLISGLAGTFRWNQVLVIENLRAAWEQGSVLRLAAVIAGTAVLVLLLVKWIALLSRETARSPEVDPRRALLLGLACAILATAGVLAVAKGHDRRRLLAEVAEVPKRLGPNATAMLALLAPQDGPTSEQPTAVALGPPRGRSAGERLVLDLVSFLHNAESRPQGNIVAWARRPRSGVRRPRISPAGGVRDGRDGAGAVRDPRPHEARRGQRGQDPELVARRSLEAPLLGLRVPRELRASGGLRARSGPRPLDPGTRRPRDPPPRPGGHDGAPVIGRSLGLAATSVRLDRLSYLSQRLFIAAAPGRSPSPGDPAPPA